MIRILTVAALAALTVTSAHAATKTIILNGKTSAQVRSEIEAAARAVCLRETTGVILLRQETIAACIKDVTKPALAEAETKLARMKPTEVLAKN